MQISAKEQNFRNLDEQKKNNLLVILENVDLIQHLRIRMGVR